MNYLKKIGISFLYTLVFILASMLLLTLFNYFNIFGIKIVNVFKIIILITGSFIGSFKLGKSISKNGYIEGIKYGLYLIIFLTILNLIFYRSFSIKNFILYLIIIISTTLGSMIGITRHVENKNETK